MENEENTNMNVNESTPVEDTHAPDTQPSMTEDKVESPASTMSAPDMPVPAITTAAPNDNPTMPTGVSAPTETENSFPAELKGWNWGAFFLGWIWSIGNRVWIGLLQLLTFIPIIGLLIYVVMAVVLGLKGNEWAWKARKYENVEEFKKVQKTWAIWGLVIFIIGMIFTIFMWGVFINFFFHHATTTTTTPGVTIQTN